MTRILLAAAALALLTGCNSETTVESAEKTGKVSLRNASMGEVAAQTQAARTAMKFTPGEWRTTAEVTDVDIPGMPAGAMKDQAMGMMKDAPVTVTHCVTPEQAERPGTEMFTGKNDGSCRFEKFDMADGRIDAVMLCDGPQGGTMRNAMAGSFTADSFTMQSEMKIAGEGPGAVQMKLRSEGKRVGDCKS